VATTGTSRSIRALQVPAIEMSVDEIESILLLESQLDRQAERRVGVVAETDRAKSPGAPS
jgi:hypothetical protein